MTDDQRREILPKLNSHDAFWLENREAILAAIENAGFRLMSNQHGFWLHTVTTKEP
jgi:hypothetical protein